MTDSYWDVSKLNWSHYRLPDKSTVMALNIDGMTYLTPFFLDDGHDNVASVTLEEQGMWESGNHIQYKVAIQFVSNDGWYIPKTRNYIAVEEVDFLYSYGFLI